MDSLGLQQLQWLFYGLLGTILLIVVLLILYVVLSSRRRTKQIPAQAPPDSTPTETSRQPREPGATSIVALVPTGPGGPLAVEVDGVRYQRLADIAETDLRRQVLSAALKLVRFTGVMGEDALSPVPLERAATWREDLRRESKDWLASARTGGAAPAARPPVQSTADEAEAEFIRSLTEPTPDAPVPPTLVGAIRRRMRGTPADEEESRSFVQEIEGILQRRIQMLPALAGRELHVRLAADGGVRFWFEGQSFADLDDLPNLTAQQLVRDAIQEWDETT